MKTENGPYRRPSEHNTFYVFITTVFPDITDRNEWGNVARKYSNIIVPYTMIDRIINEIIDRAHKVSGEACFVYNIDDGGKAIVIKGDLDEYGLTVFKLTATKVNKIIL